MPCRQYAGIAHKRPPPRLADRRRTRSARPRQVDRQPPAAVSVTAAGVSADSDPEPLLISPRGYKFAAHNPCRARPAPRSSRVGISFAKAQTASRTMFGASPLKLSFRSTRSDSMSFSICSSFAVEYGCIFAVLILVSPPAPVMPQSYNLHRAQQNPARACLQQAGWQSS